MSVRAIRPSGRLLPLVLMASGCLTGPNLIAVYPDYDYVDGCQNVTITGNNLGTTATATLGGTDLTLTAAEEDPEREDYAQDVGFEYYAAVPPGSAPGWVDLTMTVDGETLTLPDGFYYRTCPGPLTIDTPVGDPSYTGPAGATLPLAGCSIDAATTTGRLLDQTDGTEIGTFTLTQVCSTAQATWTVPAVAAGTYLIELTSGATVIGGYCEEPDTDDTDAEPCPDPILFTVSAE